MACVTCIKNIEYNCDTPVSTTVIHLSQGILIATRSAVSDSDLTGLNGVRYISLILTVEVLNSN